MERYPRRTVLGGIGLSVSAALAGASVSGGTDDDDPSMDPSGAEFESVLQYLPASVAEESMSVTVTDFESRLEADEPHDPRPLGGRFEIDPEDVSKKALVFARDDGFSRPIKVLIGDIDLEGEPESEETDDGVEYDRYEKDETVAAVTDDVVVLAESTETIEDALEASEDEDERLLESEPLLEEALETFEGADSVSAEITEEYHLPEVDDEEVRYGAHAMTVLDPDTLEMQFAVEFEDESVITDELKEALEADIGRMGTGDDPEIEVDGTLLTVSFERDLEAERAVREHDSPGFLRPDREFDLEEDDYLEIEVGRGDPTPVEELTLEVGDEEYDPEIWADGMGKIEEGDTIYLDIDDVEPNLSIRIRHDHEMGSSSSGTTILNRFRFEYEYDLEAETITVEYRDDFPLAGDRLTLAVYEDDGRRGPIDGEPEPRTTAEPWDDETLEDGSEATLEDVRPGDTVTVGWDGADLWDALGRHTVRPPGSVRFEYEYDERTLEATLELEDDERPADEYELRVDDEPADVQWADHGEVVSSGATIELEDVEVGSQVTVVWGPQDVQLAWTRPSPRIDLELEDGEVEHVGGDELAVEDLEVSAWGDDGHLEVDIDEQLDGEFSDGDTFSIDGDVRDVTVRYNGQHVGNAWERE